MGKRVSMKRRRKGGFAQHEQTIGKKQEYITPKYIIDALGGWQNFDLDPCACDAPPWRTARTTFTIHDDGLSQVWPKHKFIFLNPPYHRKHVGDWMQKMNDHQNGIALVFVRTDTDWFFNHVWGKSDAQLWLKRRVVFYDRNGKTHKDKKGRDCGAGAPSILLAYGEEAVRRLENCDLNGRIEYTHGRMSGNAGRKSIQKALFKWLKRVTA